MHVRKEVDPRGCIQLQLHGSVTQANIERDADPLATVLQAEEFGHTLLLDLSNVLAMDSSGINYLLKLQKRVQLAGGTLILHSLSPIVRNVVRVLNLQTVFRVANDPAQAHAWITKEGL